jgi:hypothetical protein
MKKRGGISRLHVVSAAFVLVLVALGAYVVILSVIEPNSSGKTSVASPTTTATGLSTSTTTDETSSIGSSMAPSTSTVPQTETSSFSSLSSSSSLTLSSPITHVIIIIMENEEYGSVIGSTSAPYENELASRYAVAGEYFGVTHPSLPNYLAIIAGSTFNVTSDCFPSQCSVPHNVSTIVSLLDAHHLSWREYAESMPINCSQSESADGLYLPKHDPFVYFDSITGDNGTGTPSTYCESHVVSLDQFWIDLQAGDLPNYSFITPNMCDDAHSCSLSTGDHWLSTVVPRITNSSSFASTALFIVYDEGTTNSSATGAPGGGKVLCMLVSPYAKQGYLSNVPYSHYSLLATVEAIFRVGSLGRGDAKASPMVDLFTKGVP